VRKKIFLLILTTMLFAKHGYAVLLTEQMDVTIGIFDAAKVELSYKEEKNSFNISADIKTANLFNTLYPFIGRYQSFGKITQATAVPEVYQTTTQSRNHIRTKKILYNAQGRAYKRISTKDKKISEYDINDMPLTADTSDLQSVFADLLEKFKKNQSCHLKREVYDGKKHYRVIAKNDGMETRYFNWLKREEKAFRCHVYIENLKDNNDNILWEVSADKPIKLLLGQDKTTKIPFVLQIVIDSTPLGMLEVTPTNLEIK
jgi:hypothetical protein